MQPPTSVRCFLTAVIASFFLWGTAGARAEVPELVIQGAQAVSGSRIQARISPFEMDGSVDGSWTAQNFTVSMKDRNGVRESSTIEQVASERDVEGLGVILLLDVSGSMRGAKIAAARQAATKFVRYLGARDQAALITFGDTAQIDQEFTGDKQALIAKIQQVQATNQNTRLYDALDTARKISWGGFPGHRSIVLLTDGVDTASNLKADDIVRLVQQYNVPVQAIAIGPQPDAKLLIRIATMTRGYYWNPAGPAALDSLYARVYNHLASTYAVTFSAPNSVSLSEPFVLTWIHDHTHRLSAEYHITEAPLIAPQPKAPQPPTSPIPPWLILLIAAVLLIGVVAAGYAMNRRPAVIPPTPIPSAPTPPTPIPSAPTPPTPTPVPIPMPVPPAPNPSFESRGPRPAMRVNAPTMIRPSAAAAPVAWLFADGGPMQGRQFTISGNEATIGRAADVDIRLADDEEVSRRHAKLVRQEDGQFQIVDMASSGGTLLNGVRVYQSAIRDGDRLELGATRLIFKSLADAPSAT